MSMMPRTSFRNPHYHRDTDLPGTLDDSFMHRVAELLLASIGPVALPA
jgi:hypothetical protein